MVGESAQWLATQLGHTDWTFTARTSSRSISDDAPQTGEKVVGDSGSLAPVLGIDEDSLRRILIPSGRASRVQTSSRTQL
jgi:hypothetical protein